MEIGVWVLALIVSAGSKLVTLILFIAAILPFWLSCFASRARIIKGFFRIRPNYVLNLTILSVDLTMWKIGEHVYYPSSNSFIGTPRYVRAVWMVASGRPLKYLLGWLIAGTRGGPTRAKIIETLKETPQNANQLANQLKMDYRTIRHHLKVLEKNKIVTTAGEGYGITYFLSPAMEENYALFEEILKRLWKK
jgi:DNA-binding transcriptional ArsR family regulator